MRKDFTKGRDILRRTFNLPEQTPAAQVHLAQLVDPAFGKADIEGYFTSDLPIGAERTEMAAKTDELAHAIDAQALAVMQEVPYSKKLESVE